MYGREVPAYETLVEVTREINAEVAGRDGGDAERLGSVARVSAERHGAIRVGTPRELAQAARVFAAFGMHPVGFYDLRDAGPGAVPVVSTAFRPLDADELARNPFRVFTSMLVVDDPRYFDADTRAGLQAFLADRVLFPPELLTLADRAAAEGGLPERRRGRAAAPRDGRVRAVVDPGRPGLVRPSGGHLVGRRGHRRGADDAPQPPHAARARHRRAAGADAVARHRDDRRDPGSARVGGPGRAAAADVVPRARRGPGVPVPRRVGAHRRVAGAVRGGRAARDRADAAGARALRPDGRRGRRARRRTRRRPGGVAAAPAGDRTRAGGAGVGVLHVPGRGTDAGRTRRRVEAPTPT